MRPESTQASASLSVAQRPALAGAVALLASAQLPTALVGLELFGSVALLRSLVVSERARGVHTIYLLTTTAEKFFQRRGFARTDRASAPPAIRATREFAGICPASSAFMSRAL
jgi:amino-acid N-acetyltransferase